DNGEGIPKEVHTKIFSPRFTTKSSGTGLGLAMCRSIVEKAHGRISFETVAGQGTVFHVHLPIVTAAIVNPGVA
ncbi:MAG: sensor histidine kinase, partial [Chitinophagia bacterium]|nr:sensor histidine kinase [Chitinophagia bacterium]